jgi:hypothetical protein
MLISAADLNASTTAGAAAQLVPTGTVFAFAGTSAPAGWLACDGNAISRTVYASLFAALGVAHGYGDNSTTFNLPDYRGRFVRGADAMFGGTAATRDPDRAGRTAANTGGNTGNTVGSVQGNATKTNGIALSGTTTFASSTHAHALSNAGGARVGFIGNTGSGFTDFYGAFDGPSASINKVGDNSGGSSATATITRNSASLTGNTNNNATSATVSMGAGDNETRPVNAYVNYIIKI